MAEMPYLGTGTDLDVGVDVTALVYEKILHYNTSMLSRLETAFMAFLVSKMAAAWACTKP